MPTVHLLRHTIATLAYRGGKAVRGVPETFGEFRPSPATRTPVQILSHIGDLLDWALSIARAQTAWHNAPPLAWDREVERFFAALRALDDYLATAEPANIPAEKLFQGPIADALTHVGQIAMLRRMSGSPMRGENYFVAEIVAGNVGPGQAQPKREFE
jgi:hypothetical protein